MQNLRDFLSENGIRQAAFADMVGRTQATISRIVSGEAQPSLDLAVAIERLTDGRVPVWSWPAFAALKPTRAAE